MEGPAITREKVARRGFLKVLLVEVSVLAGLTALLWMFARLGHAAPESGYGLGARMCLLMITWMGWLAPTIVGADVVLGSVTMAIGCIAVLALALRFPRVAAVRWLAYLAVPWWFLGGLAFAGLAVT